MDIWSLYFAIIEVLRNMLLPLYTSSYPLFLLALTLFMTTFILLTTILNILLVNYKKISYLTQEIIAWEKAKERAIKTKNRKLYNKIMRQKTRISNIKTEIEKEKMKGYIVSAIVWIISFKILTDIFTNVNIVYAPFLGRPINVTYYFILISIWLYPMTTYLIQSKILKIKLL